MNILYLVIVYLYIALLTFSGIASLFLPNFPKRWSLVLTQLSQSKNDCET